MTSKQYETIEVERHDKVVLVTLSREPALNALNKQLTDEVIDALSDYDQDPEVGCFVLTGKGKAFAAGADIKEMASKSYDQTFYENMFAKWDLFAGMRTPKIAAVNGFALGGGCELAMMCDIIFASENAKFGQPEIKLGVIPGMGGSQRLTRLIGRAKAMDMILTGRMMDAEEAERSGLVARIFAADKLVEESLNTAAQIASMGRMAAMTAIEAIDRAEHTSLSEGILFERRLFHSLFATADQKEGMAAFMDKRAANFKNK